MHTIDTVVALVLIATIVAMVTRRLRLPYTIALVVVGIGMNALGVVPDLHLTRDLLMNVLLPALLFEAALHVQVRELRAVAGTVVTLAIPGVVVAMVTTGFVLSFELRALDTSSAVSWQIALLFGALIAATDPISVVALFKQLGVPRRLSVLVEGESLLNDGTGVVVFGILLSLATGHQVGLGGAVWQFVLVFSGGAIIGMAIGLLASWVTARFDDHLIEIALTTVTAWGAFLVAERIHVSGVIATVVAGLFVGNVGKRHGMTPVTRLAVLSFWEYAAFFINSLVFLLLGMEVSLSSLWGYRGAILLAFVAVLLGRAVVVFAPLPLLVKLRQPLDRKSAIVLFWGGLRGSLSMVLALSLPVDLPGRQLVVSMTFGVVVLSILVQGSTMNWLLSRLGLVPVRSGPARWLDEKLARLHIVCNQQEALARIDRDRSEPLLLVERMQKTLIARRAQLEADVQARLADTTDGELRSALTERQYRLDTHLAEVARDALRTASAEGLVDQDTATAIAAELGGEHAPEHE